MQLTDTPGNSDSGWSAAAWTGITRSGPNGWVDAAGIVGTIPWCPGEPNNHYGSEGCTVLLTYCTPGGASAAVNDYSCDLPLRVMCAVESSPACGG